MKRRAAREILANSSPAGQAGAIAVADALDYTASGSLWPRNLRLGDVPSF